MKLEALAKSQNIANDVRVVFGKNLNMGRVGE